MGICFCSAAGFRIFIPFFIISLMSVVFECQILQINSNFDSIPILIIFFALAVLEVTGYYNPWIDNMLDLISTPLSLIAGTYLLYLFSGNSNYILKFLVTLFAGGGISLTIQLLTVKARAASSYLKSFKGNAVFATFELISAIIISTVAFLSPVFTIFLILSVIYINYQFILLKRKKYTESFQIKQ